MSSATNHKKPQATHPSPQQARAELEALVHKVRALCDKKPGQAAKILSDKLKGEIENSDEKSTRQKIHSKKSA